MANEIKFDIKGGEQFSLLTSQFLQMFYSELEAALNDTLKAGVPIVKQEISNANARASDDLFNSVTNKIRSVSQSDWKLAGEIEFKSPADRYVQYAAEGRGPGKRPPLERILVWTRYKGIDPNLAYPIARSIGAKGTLRFRNRGRQSFLDISSSRIEAVAQQNFDRIAAKIQRRLDANANNRTSRT